MSNNSYGTFYNTDDASTPSLKQTCPFTRNSSGGIHEYRAPGASDTRSVCPALNTMANHGYIPRNGRRLTFMSIYSGLKGCYGLSTPLAIFLTLGGFFLIKRLPIRLPFGLDKIIRVRNPDGSTSSPGELDLHHIGLHNGVEHDASLVHVDAKKGELYPPILIVNDYVENLVGDILPKVKGYSETHLRVPPSLTEGDSDSDDGLRTLAPSPDPSRSSSRSSMTIASGLGLGWHRFTSEEYRTELVSSADVGRMRVRREEEIAPKKMDNFHAEIARGEMAVILGVWEETHSETKKMGVPLPYLLTWLGQERLPESWEPKRTQGLLDVIRRAKEIRTAAEAIRKARG
ncbi:Cloroperoxidase [Marasmius fiardii PR-910]|nr:Cloroperoxidase [Marasmius fiardii PR-910]